MDIEQIRVRIMSEAYDLADRGDHEGYNAIKVMCSDVLKSIAVVIAAERELIARSMDKQVDLACDYLDRKWAQEMAAAIRARGEL
jgi:hypothetical protein